ncbi:MAG: hypothetical protein NTW14_14080 [bacterium]|nr:hypothetical protein [bacterium]
MLKRYLAFLSLAIILSPILANLQTVEQNVPQEWLHEGRLIVPDYNFSVASPSVDCQWSYQELGKIEGGKSTAFFGKNPTGDIYVVTVWEKQSRNNISENDTKEFVDGMMKSLPADWHVRNVDIKPVEIPLKNSTKILTTIDISNDSKIYQYAYLVTGKWCYTIAAFSLDSDEPPQFQSFVASFNFINATSNQVQSSFKESLMSIVFIVLGVLLLFTMTYDIILIIRGAFRRKAILGSSTQCGSIDTSGSSVEAPTNQKKLRKWGIFQLIFGFVWTSISAIGFSHGKDAASLLGAFTGLLFWPACIAYLFYGRKNRRDWNKFARLFFWSCILNLAFRGIQPKH